VLKTAEPGYNDIVLYVTSFIACGMVLVNVTLLCTTLYYLLRTALAYKDTKYSVIFMTIHNRVCFVLLSPGYVSLQPGKRLQTF